MINGGRCRIRSGVKAASPFPLLLPFSHVSKLQGRERKIPGDTYQIGRKNERTARAPSLPLSSSRSLLTLPLALVPCRFHLLIPLSPPRARAPLKRNLVSRLTTPGKKGETGKKTSNKFQINFKILPRKSGCFETSFRQSNFFPSLGSSFSQF